MTFVTLLAFMQLVQILMFFILPSISTLAFWRLGLKVLLVFLCEWLTLFPKAVFFPHMSHILGILRSLFPYLLIFTFHYRQIQAIMFSNFSII